MRSFLPGQSSNKISGWSAQTRLAADPRIAVWSRTTRMRKDMPRRGYCGKKNGGNGRLARMHGLLKQEDHRMSEVTLTIAQGLTAAFKLG